MNDYPDPDDLQRVIDWPYSDLLGCIDFIESIYSSYGFIKRTGKRVQTVTLVTGGWSGNEDIINAMNVNVGLMMAWEASFKGGKHVYRVKNITK